MTDREKAIVMAYTGVCMLTGEKFQIFHKYAEELMGGPVYTHQLGFGKFSEELKRRATPDFIKLCEENEENSEKSTKWIPEIEEWLPKQTGTYLVAIAIPLKTSSEPRYIATSAYYSERENTWTLSKEYADGKVIAWMPLPEPYKESEE